MCQPVEPDQPLEERQPREQEHLDQRQVAGKQRRDPPKAEQCGVKAVPVVTDSVTAARPPDPKHRNGVADDEHRQGERARDPSPAAPSSLVPLGRIRAFNAAHAHVCHPKPDHATSGALGGAGELHIPRCDQPDVRVR